MSRAVLFAKSAAWLAALAFLATMGQWAVRTAYCDRAIALATGPAAPTTKSLAELRLAIKMRPDLAEPHLALANRLLADSVTHADAELHAALALDPRDWRVWQMLALAQIEQNEMPQASASMRAAAQLDHGFAAHYQAASLALLEGDTAFYWREMDQALAVAPQQDLASALESAIRQADDNPELLVRNLPVGQPEVRALAVEALLRHRALPAALQLWATMRCSSADRSPCKYAASSLVDDGVRWMWQGAIGSQFLPALEQVWDQAVAQDSLAQDQVASGRVPNGDFRFPWLGQGFSWHDNHIVPIESQPTGPPGHPNAVRLDFDGSEPESAELFQEFVPVIGGAHYRLYLEARSVEGGEQGGLVVKISDQPSNILEVFSPRLGPSWEASTVDFTVPAKVSLIDLAFWCQRQPGQARLANAVLLANVTMQPWPERVRP